MSTEKRTVLLVILCGVWLVTAPIVMTKLGILPKQRPAPNVPPAVAAEEPAEPVAPDAANEPAKAEQPRIAAPVVAVIQEDLILGSVEPGSGYNLKARLNQAGAAVNRIELSQHEAEREFGKKQRGPLALVQPVFDTPDSFAISVAAFTEARAPHAALPTGEPLDTRMWEVVKDAAGKAIRPIPAKDGKAAGQEISFQIPIGDPKVMVTKTFRLRKGTDAIELAIKIESPEADRRVAYKLEGPHGLPIDGEWYTSIFREVLFGLRDESTKPRIDSQLAADVVKKQDSPERYMTLPLLFAGVENQYFTVFFEPYPLPVTDAERRDEETKAKVVLLNDKEKQKSDISVEMKTKPFEVGPGHPVEQEYRIFAGPKLVAALEPYGAADLAAYRKKYMWFTMPGAKELSQYVISPLLDRIYALTKQVANMFGYKNGNYGIAIILLTMTVRLCLFPLSRKQALQAKKMQDIQPLLAALKEKYKDDKEKQMREHFALMKKNNVKMSTGCLLGLIQLPIFVGLWQALNNSVALRHASFLWIDNLAAPDMLFRFPFEIPLIGSYLGPYFNLLPFAVMALMLLQMHLFTPPASTPEQEQSQKIMKPLMVFMAFMFYKVPSGLGIYFITSSSWAICERLLLPKMVKHHPIQPDDDLDEEIAPARPKLGPNGNGRQRKRECSQGAARQARMAGADA